MEARPAQVDIAQLLSAPPPSPHPLTQRLVKIHSRKVGLDIIAICLPSAGIKSRQRRQLRPCFREVLCKKCTRIKIPEMTIRLPGCRVAGLPVSKSGIWTKGQKVPYFREVLRKKCTRKKIPEIAIVLSFCPTF